LSCAGVGAVAEWQQWCFKTDESRVNACTEEQQLQVPGVQLMSKAVDFNFCGSSYGLSTNLSMYFLILNYAHSYLY
jgi:hypothetical protein